MSSNSQITLRNGKTLTCTTSTDTTEFTHEEEIVNMENDNENVDEQAQSGQSSSNPGIDSQRANDERFSHLQSEMSMRKAMMEKLLEQNEERNRQTDTNAATSSFAVRLSNSERLRRSRSYLASKTRFQNNSKLELFDGEIKFRDF